MTRTRILALEAARWFRRRLTWVAAVGESAARPGTATASPRRACRRLVTLAVCTLPAAQRARYAEEFNDELLELPRGEQLGYALRLLGRSWSLRHVLNDSLPSSRVPRPKPFLGLATVVAVLVTVFSGAGLGAKAAEPGDQLWPLTKILYPEYVRSVEAAVEVHTRLAEATTALREGRPAQAEGALRLADDELPAVNYEENRTEISKRRAELMDDLR